ncbi:MAG: hypothetical protein Q4B67_04630 [Eubacteriales bacterium]|nr:hypothetical protein [Eubacteriales bacterium]
MASNKKNTVMKNMRKCLAVVLGVLGIGFGIECIILAGWGCDPITNFDVGISLLFPISVGMADMILGLTCFAAAFIFRRQWLNLGSFLFCFGTGLSIDSFHAFLGTWGEALTRTGGVPVKIVFVIIGVLAISLSLAYYIPIDFGYAHWDIMAMFIAEATKKSYGFGLTIVYIIFFTASILLGAGFGFGTIMATLVPGWLADKMMPHIKHFSYRIAGITDMK